MKKEGDKSAPRTPAEAKALLAVSAPPNDADPARTTAHEPKEAEHREEQKLAPSILTVRRRWGYFLVVLGIVGAVGGFELARSSLAKLAHMTPTSTEHEHILLGVLLAKGVLSSAYFAFCYALVRAGERMTIPAWWLVSGEDRRAAMGAKESVPPKSFRDLIDKLIEAVAGKK